MNSYIFQILPALLEYLAEHQNPTTVKKVVRLCVNAPLGLKAKSSLLLGNRT